MKTRLRLTPAGTAAASAAEARRRILDVVRRVPRGCVASYGQIAREAGLPGRARLAGRVLALSGNEKNLPWHRVLNAAGKISLPKSSPAHAEQKRRLRADGVVVTASGVSMKRFGWTLRSAAPLLD